VRHSLRALAALRTLDLVVRFTEDVRTRTLAALLLYGVNIVDHMHQRNLSARRTIGAAVIAYDRGGLH
jgi:hypothetical protein